MVFCARHPSSAAHRILFTALLDFSRSTAIYSIPLNMAIQKWRAMFRLTCANIGLWEVASAADVSLELEAEAALS
jgi:hypothetical protein